MNSDLKIIFLPPLLVLLEAEEKRKGEKLSKNEVMSIRDNAIGMTVSVERFKELEKLRGYRDIDPENCWNDLCIHKEKGQE